MNRKIVCDSSCDLYTMSGIDFAAVPLQIITDEKVYVDDADLDVGEMVAALRHYKGRSSTSCPNVQDWLNAYEGSDEIFAVTITGTLSGSYNAACSAAEQYMQEHPGAKVHVINSLSAGAELALIAEKLRELLNSDLTFEEVREQITEYQTKTGLLFILCSVQNLANNGRATRIEAAAVGLLGIRICGRASAQGDLEVLAKARGQENALRKILLMLDSEGWKGGRVMISYCQNAKLAEELRRRIQFIHPDCPVDLLPAGALVSFYAEEGGVLMGFERG